MAPCPRRTIAPALNTRLLALERAQGVLFNALIAGTGKIDEPAVLQRMTASAQ